MSQRPIDRSPSLKRLRDEGYDILIRDGYLLMRGVPYVNASRQVERGVLISPLTLTNDIAGAPADHTAMFAGAYPCDQNGAPIERIRNSDVDVAIGNVTANHNFSAKPQPSGKYPDYHAKMTTYAQILSAPARLIDPDASPQTYPVYRPDDDESDAIFLYTDTATSRADIVAVSEKLKLDRIDIIGVGGTGSYILDLVAKTPVREIHIWDGDHFEQHNAFRAPGAASGEELEQRSLKVDYYARVYGKMRHGIIPHGEFMSTDNAPCLRGTRFAFVCIEGPSKKPVIEHLEALGIPFVDVGMGVYITNGALGGIVRTTASTPSMRNHIREKGRITFVGADEVNEYDKNIQIGELNALNAALAVIKWKKMFGFYLDQELEHFSAYAIGGNDIINEDKA